MADQPPNKPPHTSTRPIVSACMVGGVSTVFYVDKDGWLKALPNPAENDAEVSRTEESRDSYQDVTQKVDGKSIRSKTRDVAALSYLLKNSDVIRSRLYYIDDDGYLAELVQDSNDNPKGWKTGSLKEKLRVKVEERSSITALMSPPSNTIKVYYYNKDAGAFGQIWVAWWNGTTGKWATEPIVSTQK